MPDVQLPYILTDNTTADAAQVLADLNAITNVLNGNIDSTNLAADAVATTNLQDGAVTPVKTEGLPWAQDVFGAGYVISGLAATKDGTNASQLDIAAGVAYVPQADGSLKRYSTALATETTLLGTATYYLDLQADGTFSFATGHSSQTYITIATVTTDGSSNIATVTDTRTLSMAQLNVARVRETELTTTALTTVCTFTPAVTGTYRARLYLRVVTGTTTLSAQVTYADAGGAQTQPMLSSTGEVVGSHPIPDVTFDAVAGTPINIQVQAATANQAYATASIVAG